MKKYENLTIPLISTKAQFDEFEDRIKNNDEIIQSYQKKFCYKFRNCMKTKGKTEPHDNLIIKFFNTFFEAEFWLIASFDYSPGKILFKDYVNTIGLMQILIQNLTGKLITTETIHNKIRNRTQQFSRNKKKTSGKTDDVNKTDDNKHNDDAEAVDEDDDIDDNAKKNPTPEQLQNGLDKLLEI